MAAIRELKEKKAWEETPEDPVRPGTPVTERIIRIVLRSKQDIMAFPGDRLLKIKARAKEALMEKTVRSRARRGDFILPKQYRVQSQAGVTGLSVRDSIPQAAHRGLLP
jgi:hypothetical protein